MFDIKHPVKKNGTYVAKISVKNGPVRISLPFTRIVHRDGNILRLWVPEDSPLNAIISTYDDYCLTKTLEHNNEWFSNTLAEETIQAYSRRSITKNILAAIVSEVRPPHIIYNKQDIDSLDDLPDISNLTCSVELEIQGLYFLSKRFGIRWLLRSVKVEEESEDPEDAEEHRREVEDMWETDVAAIAHKIGSDIDTHRKYIGVLENLGNETRGLLATAKAQETTGPDWDAAFLGLTREIAKYYNGTIFICNKV
jgi:hypothetical protein